PQGPGRRRGRSSVRGRGHRRAPISGPERSRDALPRDEVESRGDLREEPPYRQSRGHGGHQGDHRHDGGDTQDAVPAYGETPEQRAEFSASIGADIAGGQRDDDEEN